MAENQGNGRILICGEESHAGSKVIATAETRFKKTLKVERIPMIDPKNTAQRKALEFERNYKHIIIDVTQHSNRPLQTTKNTLHSLNGKLKVVMFKEPHANVPAEVLMDIKKRFTLSMDPTFYSTPEELHAIVCPPKQVKSPQKELV